jgi:hypothetical protein
MAMRVNPLRFARSCNLITSHMVTGYSTPTGGAVTAKLPNGGQPGFIEH